MGLGMSDSVTKLGISPLATWPWLASSTTRTGYLQWAPWIVNKRHIQHETAYLFSSPSVASAAIDSLYSLIKIIIHNTPLWTWLTCRRRRWSIRPAPPPRWARVRGRRCSGHRTGRGGMSRSGWCRPPSPRGPGQGLFSRIKVVLRTWLMVPWCMSPAWCPLDCDLRCR